MLPQVKSTLFRNHNSNNCRGTMVIRWPPFTYTEESDVQMRVNSDGYAGGHSKLHTLTPYLSRLPQ